VPKDPHALYVPEVILNTVGREILCLYPHTSSIRPNISKPPPHCWLALSKDDLPMHLGLDPTYSNCLTEVDNILKRCSTIPPAELLLHVAKKYGSVASYDRVPISVLRVCSKDDSCDEPRTWKSLSDVPDDQVKRINEKMVWQS
jgi:hypothetical protein